MNVVNIINHSFILSIQKKSEEMEILNLEKLANQDIFVCENSGIPFYES